MKTHHRLIKSLRLLTLIVVTLGLVLAAIPNPELKRTAHARAVGQAVGQAAQIELVGELALPGGVHGDVWVHRSFAYVGTWSRPCTGTGVKVIDATDPTRPRLASTLAGYPGTSAEDMVVITASTSAFRGDLLAVGLQACTRGGPAGVEFWDVSDPYRPARLGSLATPGTGGVHELHLFQRGGRVFALLAVPYSETSTGVGDFRIVEVTDPRRPVQLADWGAFRDLGVSRGEARGGFRAIYGHSATSSPDGNTAYVSYWDAGLIQLDISDPARPRFIGRITYAGWEPGDTHSSMVSQDGRLLAIADEVLSAPWGFLRLYDISNPANPVALSHFATPHARGEVDATGPRGGAWYSAHNPVIRGSRLYASWFADGLRVLDISNPAAPWEIAAWVPPGSPMVWGVAIQNDLAYLSDMNHGLYIVRLPAEPGQGQQAAPGTGADFALPNGHFFTQAVGQPDRGFAVTDDDGVRFWGEFQRLGGVAGVGYPISRRFVWDGFVSQAFQKMVFQWRADEGRVYAINVTDLMHERGLDEWLRTVRATPAIADWSADQGRSWPEVVTAHQALLTDPAIREAYFAVADPVTLYGLPMAPVQDMGNVLVARAQRGIIQRWLVDVPWAQAGQVTIANSGDMAKEAGLLPATVLKPESR